MAAEWREVHCATRVKLLAGLMICPTRRFRFYSGRIVALRWALAGKPLRESDAFPQSATSASRFCNGSLTSTPAVRCAPVVLTNPSIGIAPKNGCCSACGLDADSGRQEYYGNLLNRYR
jgi:hypothetical protein